MDTPKIKINGKTITPKNPKMKAWRKFLEFFDKSNEELTTTSLAEYTDSMIELIQLSFSREEVTAETNEENLSVAELKPLTLELFNWLQTIFFTGLEETSKNAQTAEDK